MGRHQTCWELSGGQQSNAPVALCTRRVQAGRLEGWSVPVHHSLSFVKAGAEKKRASERAWAAHAQGEYMEGGRRGGVSVENEGVALWYAHEHCIRRGQGEAERGPGGPATVNGCSLSSCLLIRSVLQEAGQVLKQGGL